MNPYLSLLLLFSLLFSTISYAQTYEKKLKSRGNAFNPDIGLNTLFLAQSSKEDTSEDKMGIQEIELQLSSDVDAYFTATALLALEEEDGEYGMEPEEVFVESIAIPYFTLRAGKIDMPIGKHNQLHVHAFPFINAPLVNEAVLGEEGFNDAGFSVSGLIPLPWFSELNLMYAKGDNEELFRFQPDQNNNMETDEDSMNPESKSQNVVVGRFQNLWDFSDSMTLDLGLSWAQGKNANNSHTTLQGVDVTLKWRPVKGGKYRSFEWMTEFLQRTRGGDKNEKLSGIVSALRFQFAQRWFAQYRYDEVGLNDEPINTQRHTGLLAFSPSEFSGIRLQYETITGQGPEEGNEQRVSLQFNMSIGAHAAHKY